MEFATEKHGNNIFFSLKTVEDNLDDFACQMFGANEIPFLIPFSVVHKDCDVCLQYDITGLKTLESLVTSIITRKRLISILSGFINAYNEAEDYMLDLDNIVLDEEHVYYNRISESLRLIYLPVHDEVYQAQNSMQYIAGLFRKLKFDARDIELEQAVKNIVHEIDDGNVDSISGLKDLQKSLNLIDELISVDGDKHEKESVHLEHVNYENKFKEKDDDNHLPEHEESADIQGKNEEDKKKGKSKGINIHGIEIPGISNKQPKQKAGSFGFSIPGKEEPVITGENKISEENEAPLVNASKESSLKQENKKKLSFAIPGFGKKQSSAPENPVVNVQKQNNPILDVEIPDDEIEHTVVDSVHTEIFAKLYRISEGTTFMINKVPYMIGRGQGADCIIDNSQVSRSHALIEEIDGQFYITDQNSSNHTYINGKVISPNVRVKLEDGAQIRLSKEVLIFNY